jgi:hypothetical protein
MINRPAKVQNGGLSGIDVARVVKKLAQRAGLDAAKYAGNSLRAGHATSAAIMGASERSITNHPAPAVRSDGEAVYRGREFIPGEQRGETGIVGIAASVSQGYGFRLRLAQYLFMRSDTFCRPSAGIDFLPRPRFVVSTVAVGPSRNCSRQAMAPLIFSNSARNLRIASSTSMK